MHSYQIGATGVQRDNGDGSKSFIPFAMENRDCAQFVAEWKSGASVSAADGSPLAYTETNVTALGLTFI